MEASTSSSLSAPTKTTRPAESQPEPKPEGRGPALGTRCYSSGKQSGCRAVDASRSTTGELMHGSERQPASRQMFMDLANIEGQKLIAAN